MKIQITVFGTDWDKVRYDLSQKLGEPLSEVPQVYQNGFGAKWEFNQGFWRKGDIVAAAGLKVNEIGSCGGLAGLLAHSNQPCSEAIEITIMSAERAGQPDKRPNSLN